MDNCVFISTFGLSVNYCLKFTNDPPLTANALFCILILFHLPLSLMCLFPPIKNVLAQQAGLMRSHHCDILKNDCYFSLLQWI